MKAKKGWVILHEDDRHGTIELAYFFNKVFYDPEIKDYVKRKAWMKKYRPEARMVRATLLWNEEKGKGKNRGKTKPSKKAKQK